MEGYPNYRISGGIDWFEWWSLVHWEYADRSRHAFELLQAAKQACQGERKPFVEVHLPGFGPVRVRRMGFNRGGDRGQHFELKVQIAGVTIGVSPRNISPNLFESKLRKTAPNFVAKQSGRDCLLVGPAEGYDMADALMTALGGTPIIKRISRGDLCLDVANLDVADLLALIVNKQFITKASRILPAGNLVDDQQTGFMAGKNPLYLTAYDKVKEQWRNYDRLYYQAMIDRRWGGEAPDKATRIEFQLCRKWLRDHGVDSPEDLLNRRGKLCEYLTHVWLRLTTEPVKRRRKHQSRAKIHPLWVGIQQGFQSVFGPPEGTLAPLQRDKVSPIELARQGRGCLLNCLLQMGIPFDGYDGYINAAAGILKGLFNAVEERDRFLKDAMDRRMEYEVV